MQIEGLQIPWTFIVFVLSVVFQAGATIYMLLQHGKDIKQLKNDIKENKEDVNRRLYTSDSMPIFTPITLCDLHRAECKEARQKEYDHLASAVREHGKKVDQMVDLFNSILKRNRRKTNGE